MDTTKAEMPTKNNSRPRRRWLQYSVRSLLLVTTLLACVFGYESYRAFRQGKAVAALKAIPGGECDVTYKPRWRRLDGQQVPQWMRELCEKNPHWFNNVESVFLTGPRSPLSGISHLEAKDSDLAPLEDLRGLESLSVFCSRLGEEGWSHLLATTQLRKLEVTADGIAESHLVRIGSMHNLEELELCPLVEPNMPTAGLQYFCDLPRLRILRLSSNKIVDDDLEIVAKLVGVEELDLNYTQISDVGLQKLMALKNLKSLSLARTGVTDEGMKHLRGMSKLETVSLAETKVTEAGIRQIARNPQVKEIMLGPWKSVDARQVRDDEPIIYEYPRGIP